MGDECVGEVVGLGGPEDRVAVGSWVGVLSGVLGFGLFGGLDLVYGV